MNVARNSRVWPSLPRRGICRIPTPAFGIFGRRFNATVTALVVVIYVPVRGRLTWSTSAFKRPGAPLDDASSKEQRTSKDPGGASLDINLSDYGIPPWNHKHFLLAVNLDDKARAIKCPTLGLPNFERLYTAKRVRNLTHECLDAAAMCKNWSGLGS